MKILLQILMIGFFGNIYSQTISESINALIDKEIHKDYRKELQLELTDVFQKAKTELSIDINSVDTLYIIRGLDIQNRQAFGRVWNNSFRFHYTDPKKWENNRIINSNSKISENENSTTNFNPIINFVEIGDFEYLDKYAEENSVLSGVTWLIIRIYRTDTKIIINSHSLIDFDKL